MTIAAEVRAEMGRQNISNRALADRAGHQPSNFTRKLRGSRSITLDDFADISIALGVHPVDMLKRVAASIEGAHQ